MLRRDILKKQEVNDIENYAKDFITNLKDKLKFSINLYLKNTDIIIKKEKCSLVDR